MADDNKLTADVRTKFGKGAARRLRAAGQIPAVVYGHGTDPQHIALPGHQVMLIIRKANQVLDLDIDGKNQLALIKDVQKDPVHQVIEHLDLIVVRKGEKVTVDVPVHLEGEPFGAAIAVQDANVLSVEAEATNIPERFVVDIEGAEEGTQVLAKDVQLPAGTILLTDPDVLVVNITVPAAVDLGESEAVEGEEGEESAEGETADGESAEGDSESSDSDS